MTMQHSFETPDQAAIERHIAQARQMRSEHFGRWIKSGLASVRALLTFKVRDAKAA